MLCGGVVDVPSPPLSAQWQEIAWPFPRDGWPAGRAFRCTACEGNIELYVRPKIGFCNCDNGVADDEEVDRVADLDLISERFAALTPGEPVGVANMNGRLRSYRLLMPDGSARVAVGIAVSHTCDLLVAVAQGRAAIEDVRHAALQLLATPAVTNWMNMSMNIR